MSHLMAKNYRSLPRPKYYSCTVISLTCSILWRMSVKMFILSCLVPVPVILIYCHDLKEILWVTIFFIIVKYDSYYRGTGAQVLLMVDSKLH